MPYINIKGYPKDEATKKKVVEEINNIFIREWGCPPGAISIAVEEVDPKEWEEKVVEGQIKPNKDNLFIFNGEKLK
ncbi:MAG: tautomerase family protein [Clostridia bacterium]|nr:tautomerase family protein [Clostridia bacterium]